MRHSPRTLLLWRGKRLAGISSWIVPAWNGWKKDLYWLRVAKVSGHGCWSWTSWWDLIEAHFLSNRKQKETDKKGQEDRTLKKICPLGPTSSHMAPSHKVFPTSQNSTTLLGHSLQHINLWKGAHVNSNHKRNHRRKEAYCGMLFVDQPVSFSLCTTPHKTDSKTRFWEQVGNVEGNFLEGK